MKNISIFIAITALLALPLVSPIASTIVNSYKINKVNANSNTSFDNLYESFKNPDESMTSKPLFFWNTPLEEMTEEKVREIVRRSYEESGYSGFGILPFWQDGYMSERYFELYEAALDEGSKYGMKFSLYDENGFPSYTAGGLFAKKYPELTAKRVDKIESSIVKDGKIFLKLPQEKLLGAVAYNISTNEMIDITNKAVIVDAPGLDVASQPVGIMASSEFGKGFEIANAFDGDINTRWNASDYSGGGEYILINYGKKTKLDTVELFEDKDPSLHRIKGCDIEYYDVENDIWVLLGSTESIGNQGARISFDAVEEQYYRIYFRWVNNSASINEINLYADGQKIINPPIVSLNDINSENASGYFSSSEFSNEYKSEMAFDNNPNTRWNAAEPINSDQWISAMFGKYETIDSVEISEAFGRVRSFSIQYFDQGVWKTCATGTNIGQNLKVSFEAVTAKGIRLYMHNTGWQSWETPSIYEFKFYSGEHQIVVDNNDNNSNGEYKGSYIEYPVSGEGWKIMAFLCVSEGVQGMDYLSEEAVAGFIEITYEEYYKRFKKYFDNGTISSAFYDEPSFWGQSDALTAWGVAGGRMWTDDFNEVFKEMHGDDVNPVLCYPAMWYDIGDTTVEARDKLNSVRTEMFAKHYIGQVNEWCENHGIELMGHLLYEDIPNPVPSHGDLMYAFKYQACPSVDVIANYGMTEDYYKIVSSAAYNWDHPHVGVECYGAISGMPKNVLYKQAMDLYAKGINVMVPHAVWYDSNDVYFQPELSYRTGQYASELPQYNEYIARLQTMLQEGRHVADIAVLYPIDTLEYEYNFNINNLWYLKNNYIEVTKQLSEKIRLDYTYLHPSVLDEKVSVNGATLHLNNKNNYEDYRVMILPDLKVISKSNLEKINEFYNNGGIVISIGSLPYMATEQKDNATINSLIQEMFGAPSNVAKTKYIERTNDNGGKIYHLTNLEELELTLWEANDYYDVSVTDVNEQNGHFTYIHKVLNNNDIYFFANSSDIAVNTTVTLRGEFERLEVWNPMTGDHTPLSIEVKDGMTSFEMGFDSVTSLFIVGEKKNKNNSIENGTSNPNQTITDKPKDKKMIWPFIVGFSIIAVGAILIPTFLLRRKKEQ